MLGFGCAVAESLFFWSVYVDFSRVCGFVFGYVAIVMEHRWHVHKTHTALFLGSLLWAIIAVLSGERNLGRSEIGREVFELVAFLFGGYDAGGDSYSLSVFDFVRMKIQRFHLTDSGQIWLLASVAFFFSSIIDNLTTTIVMVQIARRFFRGNNLLVAAAAIDCRQCGGVLSDR